MTESSQKALFLSLTERVFRVICCSAPRRAFQSFRWVETERLYLEIEALSREKAQENLSSKESPCKTEKANQWPLLTALIK